MKNIFLSLIFTSFIVGCSQVPVQQSMSIKPATVDSFDVGNGQKGAQLSVNIDFNSFNTKASANGLVAKTVSDINSAKLYLIKDNNANPLLASNVVFSSGILAYPAGSVSKTYTFSNIPTGIYYVAVELFSDINATVNIIEPLTYIGASIGDTSFGMNGKRGLAISTNFATVISPDMSYSFSDLSDSFIIKPILLDAVGASLDTNVNLQSGENNISEDSIVIQ